MNNIKISKINNSLQRQLTKVILIISLSIILISAAGIIIFQVAVYNSLLGDKKQFIRELYWEKENKISQELSGNQLDSLQSTLNHLARTNKILQAEVYLPDGSLLLQSEGAADVDDLSEKDRRYVFNLIRREKLNHYQVLVLLSKIISGEDRIGYFKIYYSLNSIWDTIYLINLITLVFFLGLFSFMTWILNKALQKLVLSPVQQLQDAIYDLKSGKFPKSIPVSRPDEIGEVTREFEELARKNEASRLSLVEKNRELERLTGELQNSNNILKNQIKEIEQKEQSLSRAIQNKDMIMKDVHHRVKDNMQIISSLLKLQAYRETTTNIEEIIQITDQRIQTISLIHEQLYGAEDLLNIDFGKYTNSLVLYLFQYYKADTEKITPEIVIESINIGVNMAIPLGLIICELVTNTLKNADRKVQPGQLFIIMEEDDQNIKLVVHDTMEGIAAEAYLQGDPSFGLNLVNILAEDQLKGKINLNNDDGSRIEISIPKEASPEME